MITRILKLFISINAHFFDQLVMSFREISGNKIPPRHIVLYYHSIPQAKRECFARQMDEVVRLTKQFSLDEKYPNLNGTYNAAISFDDGFISFLENALPELIKRNIPFTVFVPTGYLDKYPDWIEKKSLQFKSEKVMTQEQLRELKKLKIASIGSHCVTHQNLMNLKEDEARNEIFQSKVDLEKILEREITALSFPHGGFNKQHIEYAKQAGYRRVFSINPVLAFAAADEYMTGRIKTDPDDWFLEFRLKLFGAYRWLPFAFNLKKRIRTLFFCQHA